MLTETSKETYRSHFTEDPHPYITEGFIDLVKQKTEKVVHLITNEGNISLFKESISSINISSFLTFLLYLT